MPTPTLTDYHNTIDAIADETLELFTDSNDIERYIWESVTSSEWTFKTPHLHLIETKDSSATQVMYSDVSKLVREAILFSDGAIVKSW